MPLLRKTWAVDTARAGAGVEGNDDDDDADEDDDDDDDNAVVVTALFLRSLL